MKPLRKLTQKEIDERIEQVSKEIQELAKPRNNLTAKISRRRKHLKELKTLSKGQMEIKVQKMPKKTQCNRMEAIMKKPTAIYLVDKKGNYLKL